MIDTSTTFSGWSDRLTYILAHGQLVVLGVLVSIGVTILWVRPSMPGVPAIVWGWFAALTLLGPPLLALFVTGARWLRQRQMVDVQHINAEKDIAKPYYVAPEIWKQKKIDGPNPYPVNDGSTWAVKEFDWDLELQELRVKGVWLSEIEDTKMWTSKSHFERIYKTLTESHIALGILRDSVEQFGADLQHRLINRMAEARERGKLMDPKAVSEVFEDFKSEVEGLGADDLPTLELEEDLTYDEGQAPGKMAQKAADEIFTPDVGVGGEHAATDGGHDDGR